MALAQEHSRRASGQARKVSTMSKADSPSYLLTVHTVLVTSGAVPLDAVYTFAFHPGLPCSSLSAFRRVLSLHRHTGRQQWDG